MCGAGGAERDTGSGGGIGRRPEMEGRGGARRAVRMYVRNEIRGVGDEEEREGEGWRNLRAWVGLWICAVGCGWVLVVVSGPTSS